MSSKSAAVIGSTGLVGSHIFSQLLASPEVSNVVTLARREPKVETGAEKLKATISAETDIWPQLFKDAVKATPVTALFSGLATTRGAVGGFANQYKIDHDLNLEMAKAAKEAGVETYAIISSTGANAKSLIQYSRMKGELDEAVIKLGFKRTIIARPGFLAGDRGGVPRPYAEKPVAWIIGGMKSLLGRKGVDFWAIDGADVARATIRAAFAEGADFKGDENGVWIIGHDELVKLADEAKK